MARQYAAIMALVGVSVSLLRSIPRGGGIESNVTYALGWMATLAVVGLVVGVVAEQTIEESVQARMEEELARTENALV